MTRLQTASARRAGVLLDVDGTLIDSNYLHTLAWSRALIDIGEWAPMNAIHRSVGMGGDQLVAHLLGKPRDEASAAWRTRYEELSCDARAFPFARELVERLRDSGLKVAFATSSPSDLLQTAMQKVGVEGLVDAATTADDVASSKPDPAVFEVAMQSADIDPEFAIAVGDSVWDVRAARAAGIACVGVESGGFSRHELSEEGAIAVYKDVEQLWRQLSTSPLARLAHG
ncbi:MAG: HAD family hydrolase [Acidimicrobiales bacterium]